MRNGKYVCWPCGNDAPAAGCEKVEQTCTLARCNLNRHARWSSATVPRIPVSWCNCNIHYCWCDVTNTHDCWPRVSLNGMCAGSVPHYQTRVMLMMSDMMSWWYYVAALQWLLSPYLCFISSLYLDLYVLGDDALTS